MANKEEVLIQVKAELAGFKKSMEQIKKIAKDTVKDIEKSMAMDLTSAGVKAGRTFVTGFNSQVRNMTNNINAALNNVDANIDVKIEADTSGIKDSLSGLSGSVDIDTAGATSSLSSLSGLAGAGMMSSAAESMKKSMSGVTGSIESTYDRIKDVANAMTAVNTSANTYAKYVGYGEKAILRLSRDIKTMNKAIAEGTGLSEVQANKIARTAAIVENELSNIFNSDLLGNFKNAGIDTSSLEVVFNQVEDLKTEFDRIFASMNNNSNAPNMDGIANEMNEVSESVEDLDSNVIELKKHMKDFGDSGWDVGGIQSIIDYIMEGLKDIDDSERRAKAAADDWADSNNKVAATMARVREEANLMNAIDTFDNSQESGIAFLRILKEIDDKYKGTLSSIQATDLGKILADKFDIPIDPSIFEDLGNNITKALKDIDRDADFSMVTGDIDHLADAFELNADRIRKAMLQIRMATGSSGGSPMTTALSGSEQSVNKFVSTLRNLGGEFKSAFGEVGQIIGNVFSKMKSSLKPTQEQMDAITNKVDKLKNKLKNLSFKDIEKAAKPIANVTKNLFKMVGSVTGLNKVGNAIKNIGKHSQDAAAKTNGLKSSLSGIVGKLAGLFGLYQLGSIMVDGTKEAIKYEAALMNIQRTLGSASKSLIDFANNNAVNFGVSKRQVMEYGNIFSMIVSNFEEDGAKVAKTTEGLIRAAGAIASGTGRSVEEVLESLRSGILGSSEAVDQLGLNLKTAQLAAAAGVDSWDKLSEAQKQAIITQEILNQTMAKYGGVARNTASMHNAFVAQLANTKLALGNVGKAIYTAILPALTYLMAVLEKVFNYVAKVMSAILGLFGMEVQFSGGGGTGGALNDLSDSAGAAGDALNNAGDAAKNAGSGAKKAANDTKKAAKEIKRALAGFDQINVLSLGKDNDSDSDGGKDTTPGGGGDISSPDPGNFGDIDLNDALVDTEIVQKGLSDKMKKLLEEIMEPFKNAWDLLGVRWIKAWNDLQVSFKNFCDALSDFMVSVWNNGGKEFVQHMAEIALAVGIAAMEIGGTILDSLANLWRHLDPENNSSTQNLLNSLNEVAVKVRDLILDLSGHFDSLMQNGGQDVLNALGTAFMDVGDAAVRGVGVVVDAIDGLLDHLDPINNEIARNMLQVWEDAFLSIGNAAQSFADLLESALDNGGQGIINALGDLAVQIGTLWGTIVDEVADAAAKLFRHMDPALNPNSAGALEGLKYFVESIKGFVEMLGESFKTFMDNGGQEFVNNVGDIVAILIDLAATIGGDIINSVTGFFNSWAGQVVIEAAARVLELLSSVIKGLLEILKPFTPVISAVITGILGFMAASKVVGVITKVVSVFKSAGTIFGLVKGAATALWGVLMANPIAAVVAAIVAIGVALVAAYNKFDWFKEAVDKILSHFEGLFSALKGLFSNILNDITNIFQDIIDIVVGIFTGDGQRVGEAVKSLIGNILQLFGDLLLGIIDVGVNLIAGLVKGIGEGIKMIPAALKAIFDFVVDFFKGLFGIHSPSTVFAEFGVNLLEGLAKGITSAFKTVGNALKAAFDYIKGVVEKAWNAVVNFLKGVWDKIKKIFQPVADFYKGIFTKAWDNIKNAWSNVVDWFTKLWNGIKKVFDVVANYYKDIFTKAWNNIKSAWSNVKSWFSDIWSGIKNTFSNVGTWFKDKFTSAWSNVKSAWSGSKSWFSEKWSGIKDVFSNVGGWFKDKFSGIKSAITSPFTNAKSTISTTFENIKTTVKNAINKVKGMFNFSWSLPKIKLPHFKVSGGKAPWGFMGQGSLPSVSVQWYKQGGIMMNPTVFGMNGNQLMAGGEAGAEAILPLDRLWSELDKQFQRQNSVLNNSLNRGTDRPVNITLKMNDIEMGRATVNSLKALANHSGEIDLPL